MTAEGIAKALGGRRYGSRWMARCPCHPDRTASLSIRDDGDKTLIHCFGFCTQGDVIAELRSRSLWGGSGHREASRPRQTWQGPDITDDARRTEMARRISSRGVPAPDTLVETHFRSRGITIEVPPTIRFAPALKHWPSGESWPAMVAALTIGGKLVGIPRTFAQFSSLSRTPPASAGSRKERAIRYMIAQDTIRKVVKTPQAAEYVGLSASTLEKLRLLGGGPIFIKLGKRVAYHVDDLDLWLAANRRGSTSEDT
jgi:hypothetical protein